MLEKLTRGEDLLHVWLIAFILAGLAAGLISGFFKARKIQPNGFRWRVFRHEVLFAIINLTITAFTLGPLVGYLKSHGIISFHDQPTSWWRVALEYALYFFLFDTWFYWLHRLMHKRPFYEWIHKIHHKSTSPNLLTTVSESPLESLINGGFVPLFLAVFTVHGATMALIGPTNILMGLYVHSGYEFFPRWWNRTWTTKWFITATFHDQHHKYFRFNYGGYTTLWDRLCGTMRPQFVSDFERPKTHPATPASDTGKATEIAI